MVLKAGVLTVLGNVQWEIQRWFYSLWAHIMNPRQSSVVPNASVIKCIFMEDSETLLYKTLPIHLCAENINRAEK